jgi:hypothetical protein
MRDEAVGSIRSSVRGESKDASLPGGASSVVAADDERSG